MKKVTRELAEAAAYFIINHYDSVSDVAHDYKVDKGDLAALLDKCETYDWRIPAEEAVADWIEDGMPS